VLLDFGIEVIAFFDFINEQHLLIDTHICHFSLRSFVSNRDTYIQGLKEVN
jgi:hypothetical protein